MHEDVRADVLLDEPPALLVVEPLDFTDCHVSSTSKLANTRDAMRTAKSGLFRGITARPG
jgi:hypothetical protein